MMYNHLRYELQCKLNNSLCDGKIQNTDEDLSLCFFYMILLDKQVKTLNKRGLQLLSFK